MPAATLKEALEAQILGLNQRFKEADADLHAEVAALANVVSSIAVSIRVKLAVKNRDHAGTRYVLNMHSPHVGEVKIGLFEVPTNGYPIRAAASTDMAQAKQISSRAELSQFFLEMANNPDSALVRQAAFFARQAS